MTCQTIETEALPIRVWAVGEIDLDDQVFVQARNLANLPIAREWICLMPDYHVGYGMPIGGVLATEGGVVPNAVGVDIGCGMIAARTAFMAGDFSRDQLQAVREAVHARVPVGLKHHESRQPLPEDLVADSRELPRVSAEIDRAAFQVGTLGSGNHFIELQRDEEGRLWIMLHSGSRNVGFRVCNHYHGEAKALMQALGVELPDMDLAYLPADSPLHDEYLAEMAWCMRFAEANRIHMFGEVCDAIEEVIGARPGFDLRFDTHHNFARMERHSGKELLVHRKGAVRAEGLVTIPGSMGTASYIGEGLLPAASFETCSHGAGRVMGRKEANRTISHEQAVAQMSHVVFGVRAGDYDEMPVAYKDIDNVMQAQADLVRPVHRLLPLAVVKG
jgi:tRNA-splicing ligase RtcB